jgi:hypothetical protein
LKELPDEGGSDLVSIFAIDKDLGLGQLEWLVFRVQVKMGTSGSSYTKQKNGQNVIEMMKSHEQGFANRLGVSMDRIKFVRVLWTAQKTTVQDSPSEDVHVIDSAKMLKWWSPRLGLRNLYLLRDWLRMDIQIEVLCPSFQYCFPSLIVQSCAICILCHD